MTREKVTIDGNTGVATVAHKDVTERFKMYQQWAEMD